MKQFRHEAELFKAALVAGVAYAEGRKEVEFVATDSASDLIGRATQSLAIRARD